MAHRTCSVDGCDRPHCAKGYCSPHWQRWKKNGDPGPAEVRSPHPKRPEVCTVDGCERSHAALGYCHMHAARFRKDGAPGPVEKLTSADPKGCAVEGCDRPHTALGYCSTHYQYVQHKGIPHEELRPIEMIDPLGRDEHGRKQCTMCEGWKPLAEYKEFTRGRDGLNTECLRCERGRALKKYSMTIDEYEQLAETQGGLCAICGRTNPSGKALHVDHDHACCPGTPTCGKCTRMLLCGSCNQAIGYLQDDPEIVRKAAAYLETHRDRDRSEVRAARGGERTLSVY